MASIISAGTTTGTAIAISGDTTGNLAFQTQAGANTITVPNATGTMMVSGNMPAFSAYLNTNQTITSGVETIAQLNAEEFDTASRFNNTGSTVGGIPAYAFLPNVAGYYQINWRTRIFSTGGYGSISNFWSTLQKNGAELFRGTESSQTTSTFVQTCSSYLVYLNGTTDYIQLSVFIAGSGTIRLDQSGSANQYTNSLSGFLARAA